MATSKKNIGTPSNPIWEITDLSGGVGKKSHAEGFNTLAAGYGSHSEGVVTTVTSRGGHAEGLGTTASVTNNTFVASVTPNDWEVDLELYQVISITAPYSASDNPRGFVVCNALLDGYRPVNSTLYIFNTDGNDFAMGGVDIGDVTLVNNGTAVKITFASPVSFGGNGEFDNIESLNIEPTGIYPSHAEGWFTKATGAFSHSEGYETEASGNGAHTEGGFTQATGTYAHAEGQQTKATGEYSHAEGLMTTASALFSHAEGVGTIASGNSSHAEGNNSQAKGEFSHAEGTNTLASTSGAHAEGGSTIAAGVFSHAEGGATYAGTGYSHAEGLYTLAAYGNTYFITSFNTSAKTLTLDKTTGLAVNKPILIKSSVDRVTEATIKAIDGLVITVSVYTNAKMKYVILPNPSDKPTHVEGYDTTASGWASHAEGNSTGALGDYAHSEGDDSQAIGTASHAQGYKTIAGNGAHAEGYGTMSGIKGYIVSTFDSSVKSITTTNGTFPVGKTVYLYLATTDWSAPTILTANVVSVIGNVMTLNTDPIGGVSGGVVRFVTDRSLNNPSLHGNHAEGMGTLAMNEGAHAEGLWTRSSDFGSHSEGIRTNASAMGAHAEGYMTTVYGWYAHAEGNKTLAQGDNSHAEGNGATASGLSSHAEGSTTIASAWSAHAEGAGSIASSENAHAEGSNGFAGYSEGISTINGSVITIDNSGHSFQAGDEVAVLYLTSYPSKYKVISVSGANITVNGSPASAFSLVLGLVGRTVSKGLGAHAEGVRTIASSDGAHAEGQLSRAYGLQSHAEGYNTRAWADQSHAEGNGTIASGPVSHAEGKDTVSIGFYTHAEGVGTRAMNYASHAMGQYNKNQTGNPSGFITNADAFVIGNGTSSSSLSNAFRVTFDGKTYALAAFNSTGADYAEYFEWLDGNINSEDRVGYFVTLDGEMIRKATSEDYYILGVISSTPSVVGDSHDDWHDKYLTDAWGRVQHHDVIVPALYKIKHHEAVYSTLYHKPEFDENGVITKDSWIETLLVKDAYSEEVLDTPEKVEIHPVYNPNWNPNEEYVLRENRKEWSAVGMMGKLLVHDDGTCVVNGFCKSNDNGEATKSDTGYRVMKRVSENIVQILVK